MHEGVQQVLFVWHVVLVATLVVWAARGAWVFRPAVAVEVLGPVFVGAIALLAIGREEPSYLEIALVVALLAYVQTVVIARAVVRRREQRAREGGVRAEGGGGPRSATDDGGSDE